MAQVKQFVYPCYQQGLNDCGYYCLRVAAEITLKRKFNKNETSIFRDFKGQCAETGAQLALSTARFASYFPDIGVHFNELSSYVSSAATEEYISPDAIKQCLDQGHVVVLNIQNIAFRGKTLVRSKGRDNGHNICCVGYDDSNFIFQDSNKSSKSCKKTMRIQTLQTGYEQLVKAGEDLEKRLKAMFAATHVTEMYVADTENKQPTLRVRRSRRKRIV